tara:strand:- start:3894 stop:5222 length:1329 start_codon:yes stop_codon:yes gene_type:complete
MFYIIESEDQLERVRSSCNTPTYVDVIPTNDNYHPKLSNTVAIYLKPLNKKEGYLIPISHYDGLNVEKERIYAILNEIDILYTLDKKKLLYHFNLQGAIDISLAYSMVYYKRLEYSTQSQTIDWYYNRHSEKEDINRIIPIGKLYQRCEAVYNKIEPVIKKLEIPDGFNFYNNTATNVFFLIEQQGVGVNYEEFNIAFDIKKPIYNSIENTVLTYYNLYNSTSRPTNSYNSVNFAAIPHTEKHRNTFKPQNDHFVELDFDGYHLRLLCEQIGYELTDESAHKQLAKHYFGTEDITDEQYIQAKQINFQAIYGKIPEEHRDLQIFKLIQSYIDEMWRMYKEEGFVCNPQSGKPFTSNLKEMHPAKLMNYMMQSLETSNNIGILKDVLRYLKDKKTFITLYTYDSITIDFSKDDGKEVLENIQKIMEKDGRYPTKWKAGKNLYL